MMLRGRPGGGVEPAIPGTQRVRREGLGGKWGAISDDRVGWRGQRGGACTEESPGRVDVPGTRALQGR